MFDPTVSNCMIVSKNIFWETVLKMNNMGIPFKINSVKINFSYIVSITLVEGKVRITTSFLPARIGLTKKKKVKLKHIVNSIRCN